MDQNGEGKKSIEEEIIKELMNLRSYLERRIKELDEEQEKLRALFKIVDEVIVAKSFKKAETIPLLQPEAPPQPRFKEEVPLKTSTGILLATMFIGEEEALIVPAEGLVFTVKIPPFQTFLITRILEAMRTRDSEDSTRGAILRSQIFSYETVTEGDVLKELIIRNYRVRRRLREIISAARWTLEKMYEKIQSSNNAT